MSKELSSLPVGTKIKDKNTLFNGVPIIWIVGEHGHYGAGKTVLISEKVLQFMCFDAKESGGSSNRKNYGNNNYEKSNIDQWLNSDAGAGQWWSSTHSYDQAPSNSNVGNNYNEYDAKVGFLNGFSNEFKAKLQSVSIPYKYPSTEGGSLTNLSRKVFLASAEEIGTSRNGEGSIISYFSTGTSGAYPTTQAVANSEYSSSTYVNVSKYARFWLRSWYEEDYNVCVQNNSASASLNGDFAYYGYSHGVRPLVNLPSTIKLSDSADTDGAYEIIWNTAPTIADIPAKGEQKTTPFNIAYTASDVDGDVLSVSATLNGHAIYSKNNVVSGTAENIQITKAIIDSYGVNGTNTIVVSVYDGSVSVSKSTTFTRSQTDLTVQGAAALSCDEMPEEIGIKLVADVPDGATMFVFCCNNGNDTNPIWEDCTQEVINGEMYTFTNKTKTATKWGVNIKVVIQKGTATEEISVGGFGGVV